MMGRLSILPAADLDLDEQVDFLTREANSDTARRFYDAAERAFSQLARMPGLGEPKRFSDPRLAGMRVGRIEGFVNHLIHYRPTDDGIEIIRILHASRDLDRIFGL